DNAEEGVLERADDQDGSEQRPEDGVEAGEDVGPQDVGDRARRGEALLVPLSLPTARVDLGCRESVQLVSVGDRHTLPRALVGPFIMAANGRPRGHRTRQAPRPVLTTVLDGRLPRGGAVTATDHAEGRSATPASARKRSPMGRRAARWRLGTFGPASEEPYRRRVIDRVRLAAAALLLAGLVMHSNYPSAVEKDVFRLVNDLPG